MPDPVEVVRRGLGRPRLPPRPVDPLVGPAEIALREHKGQEIRASGSLGISHARLREIMREYPRLREVQQEERARERETIRGQLVRAAEAGDAVAIIAYERYFGLEPRPGVAGQGGPVDWSREVRAARDCTDEELEALCRRALDQDTDDLQGNLNETDAPPVTVEVNGATGEAVVLSETLEKEP